MTKNAQVTIRFEKDGIILGKITRVLIKSISGQEFFRWCGNEYEIDGHDAKSGEYIVKLRNDKDLKIFGFSCD